MEPRPLLYPAPILLSFPLPLSLFKESAYPLPLSCPLFLLWLCGMPLTQPALGPSAPPVSGRVGESSDDSDSVFDSL